MVNKIVIDSSQDGRIILHIYEPGSLKGESNIQIEKFGNEKGRVTLVRCEIDNWRDVVKLFI